LKIFLKSKRAVALIESALATIIWASSFVFVKIELEYMGPLTIAGFRYFLAFIILLPFLVHKRVSQKEKISGKLWLRLLAIGLSAYTLGNGALFWALLYLPATTVSFLMSLLPLIVLFGSVFWLKEIPTRWQVFGVVLSFIGSGLFFSVGFDPGASVGIVIVLIGLIGFMMFGILGREIAREKQLDTLTLTTIPLAIGGGFLLAIALLLEDIPVFTPESIGIVLWLAVVNTAAAYVLYNHSLQVLTALEMNVMLNLTPLGTALLAWLILGESLGPIQLVGMLVMIVGMVFVQRVRNKTR